MFFAIRSPTSGPAQRAMVAAAVRTLFTQENQEAARRQWPQVADGSRARFERLAEAMDDAEDDLLADMTFHPDRCPNTSSHHLERLIGEIKRRTDWLGSSRTRGEERQHLRAGSFDWRTDSQDRMDRSRRYEPMVDEG